MIDLGSKIVKEIHVEAIADFIESNLGWKRDETLDGKFWVLTDRYHHNDGSGRRYVSLPKNNKSASRAVYVASALGTLYNMTNKPYEQLFHEIMGHSINESFAVVEGTIQLQHGKPFAVGMFPKDERFVPHITFETYGDVSMNEVFKAIRDEREFQDEKWGEQNHDDLTWFAILSEEVGEVAQSMLHDKFGGHSAGTVSQELTQVAAVAVQWLQCINRRGEK